MVTLHRIVDKCRLTIEVIVVSLTFVDYLCDVTNYEPNAIEVIVVSLHLSTILCNVTNYEPNAIEVIVVSLTFVNYPVRCDQL